MSAALALKIKCVQFSNVQPNILKLWKRTRTLCEMSGELLNSSQFNFGQGAMRHNDGQLSVASDAFAWEQASWTCGGTALTPRWGFKNMKIEGLFGRIALLNQFFGMRSGEVAILSANGTNGWELLISPSNPWTEAVAIVSISSLQIVAKVHENVLASSFSLGCWKHVLKARQSLHDPGEPCHSFPQFCKAPPASLLATCKEICRNQAKTRQCAGSDVKTWGNLDICAGSRHGYQSVSFFYQNKGGKTVLKTLFLAARPTTCTGRLIKPACCQVHPSESLNSTCSNSCHEHRPRMGATVECLQQLSVPP